MASRAARAVRAVRRNWGRGTGRWGREEPYGLGGELENGEIEMAGNARQIGAEQEGPGGRGGNEDSWLIGLEVGVTGPHR